MVKKIYLLDTNIIIKIWRECPNLLDEIENSEEVDFKIHKDIAGELSRKEFRNINGIPVLSDRFIKLLNHVIDDESNNPDEHGIYGDFIKPNFNNNMYFVNGNKISVNDFSLIRLCKGHEEYILVTEDKKIIKSAKNILGDARIFNFEEFIKALS